MGNTTNRSENHSVFRTASIVSLIVMFGKIIGFIRDAVIASFYGVTWETDAFFFAQSMPSLVFPAVCSSLSTAFITMYVSRRIKKGPADGDKFASRMLITTIGISILLSIVSIFIMPWVVPVFAPGFQGSQRILAIRLSRITMGSFALTMFHYMAAAILNSRKMFYSSQIAAVVYNIAVIILTFIIGANKNVWLLTYTVILGHLLQSIVLLYFLLKHLKINVKMNPFHKDSKMLIKLALPILLGNSLVQLNNIIDKLIASLLQSGAVSALSYSSTLNRLVTGIFITTLSTVIYPSLSTHIANNDEKKFNSELLNSLSALPIVILPISIITAIFATDIVTIVYQRGSFDASATRLTAAALTFYAGMYVFSSIQEVIIRAFYALKDTKTPMINVVVAVIANSIISAILSRLIGIGGIALGTTISTAIASIILWVSLKKKLPDLKLNSMYSTIVKVIISSVGMIIFLVFLKQYNSNLVPLVRFLLATIMGFTVYFSALFMLKCREMIIIMNKIKETTKKK